jgi:hypothetical protein
MANGRKICISLDQSPISKDAFAWAAKHVIRGGDQVYLVSVIQPAIKTELAFGAGGRAPMVDLKDEVKHCWGSSTFASQAASTSDCSVSILLHSLYLKTTKYELLFPC